MASNITVQDDGDSRIVINPSDLSNGAIEARSVIEQTPATRHEIIGARQARRESGDHVNRFLLCSLVSESSKRIKEGAERIGVALPMTVIVRSVLRSYRLAAQDRYGPLAEKEPDAAGLARLNEKVLKDEVARHSRDRVRSSEARLAHARRLGDDAWIQAESDNLERAIVLRDRMAEGSR